MKSVYRQLAMLAVVLGAVAHAARGQRADCRWWDDPVGDSAVRRTDFGNDGLIHPLCVLPDLRRVSLCGWDPDGPEPDPYEGETVDMEEAQIFRLDIVFNGLVNPPGPIGLDGEFDPYLFGDSPVLGTIEFDVDDDRDTGGELDGAAESRYLANVARFAQVPDDDHLDDRTATSRADIDGDFWTGPQYERSGADFSFVMCGCFTPEVVPLVGDGDLIFEAGESWLVFGRFFERAKGYRAASAAHHGSAPGLYDPILQVRFSHDEAADETTVTLVWALDHLGAAELKGEPVQEINTDVSDHTSIVEALEDIIAGANDGGIFGSAWELVRRWRGRKACDYLDMHGWGEITSVVGVPYAVEEPALYAWTDVAGPALFADLDGDGLVDGGDEQLVRDAVFAHDGMVEDADGAKNGVWVLIEPGWNFSLYDTDGNMRVDLFDQAPYGPLGDFTGEGEVDIQDFIAFLNAWAARLPSADFNLDQDVDTTDFIAFLNAWVAG